MDELVDLVQIWIHAVDWQAVRDLDARALLESPAVRPLALALGAGAAFWIARRLPRWARALRRASRVRRVRAALRGRPCPVPLASALGPYVTPDCASADPEHDEALDRFVAREPALHALERFVWSERETGRLLLLGGSGVGKTALLIQYLARLPADRRALTELVFLGDEAADKTIAAIENPQSKTLLLDAFDDDPRALGPRAQGLRELLEQCRAFRRVVITASPEGFGELEASGAQALRALGIDALYLCPLTPEQAERYVQQAVRGGRRQQRALQILRDAPQLTSRPIVLRHLHQGLAGPGTPTSGFELYQRLVDQWVANDLLPGLSAHERADLQEPVRRWLREVALELYLGRHDRGTWSLPPERLQRLAERWKVPLASCALGGRSFLVCDARGQVRFSHRSILDYLYVEAVLALPGAGRPADPWSDAMKKFVLSQLGPECDLRRVDLSHQSLARMDLRRCNLREANLQGTDLRGADLRGADLRQADLRGALTERARSRDADLAGVIRD